MLTKEKHRQASEEETTFVSGELGKMGPPNDNRVGKKWPDPTKSVIPGAT